MSILVVRLHAAPIVVCKEGHHLGVPSHYCLHWAEQLLVETNVQVVVDVLAEVLGGDLLMQRLQAAIEAAVAQHSARSMQAALVLDVSLSRQISPPVYNCVVDSDELGLCLPSVVAGLSDMPALHMVPHACSTAS